MPTVRVEHGIGDLTNDLIQIPARFYRGGRQVVTAAASDGGRTARRTARWTAGRHAKLYPKAITWDRATTYSGFGGGEIKAEFGPVMIGQGLLADYLENGSRNNPPHNDLANAQDLIRPSFHRGVDHLLTDLFWAGGDR
jgi:hypothetical protein